MSLATFFDVMDRRRFLNSVGGCAVAAALPSLAAAQSGNPYFRPIKYFVHNHFNRAQLAIIGPAMNLVAHRMLDPRMIQWVRGVYRYRYWSFDGRAGSVSPRNKEQFEAVAWTQLRALLASGFPGVMQLRGAYDAGGSWTARATVGKVVAEFRRGRSGSYAHVAGNFDVTINTAALASHRFPQARSADYWAGTITHEMLHNLGHEHPENVYEGTYIRGYEKAVWYNANPKLR